MNQKIILGFMLFAILVVSCCNIATYLTIRSTPETRIDGPSCWDQTIDSIKKRQQFDWRTHVPTEMDEANARELCGELKKPIDTKFYYGQPVKVIRGFYRGQFATVKGIVGNDKYLLLTYYAGTNYRNTEITVNENCIEEYQPSQPKPKSEVE
jgi:hypothetical protein